MKDYSVIMALADFVPVILFAAAAVILQRSLYNKMSKGAFALFAAGTIDIVCAGALKALYKLLYAAGICDFEALSNVFFPLQSIGFMLAGIGMISMLLFRQDEKALAVVPPIFSGTFVFVGLMVAGLGLIDVGLCILSCKLKKPILIALFVVSFFCSLGMGYLSSRDFDGALMNWIAEGVNTVGQGTLLLGSILLSKSGLSELKLKK